MKFKKQKTKIPSNQIKYGNQIDNLMEKALPWYDIQNHETFDNSSSPSMIEQVDQTILFPNVQNILPTVERSFNSLGRVKTWLRSTMSDKVFIWYLHFKCSPR